MFKIYDADAGFRGAITHAEDAAAFVSILGPGSTIQAGNLILWREGCEGGDADGLAAESYDRVAELIHARYERHKLEARMYREPLEPPKGGAR